MTGGKYAVVRYSPCTSERWADGPELIQTMFELSNPYETMDVPQARLKMAMEIHGILWTQHFPPWKSKDFL